METNATDDAASLTLLAPDPHSLHPTPGQLDDMTPSRRFTFSWAVLLESGTGPPMKLFITGTDTEVGKSVVTACLAQAARRTGSIRAIKPLASGVPDGEAGEDAQLIAASGGHEPAVFQTWVDPLSPHRAALIADRPLDPQALTRWLTDQAPADCTLIEGVGGWEVPLSLDPWFSVPDLAQAVQAPVLIVAANRLGVLNHTLLTVRAIQRAGLTLLGVVLNQAPGQPDPSQSTNLEDLRLLLDIPVVPNPTIDPWDPVQRDCAGQALWAGLKIPVGGGSPDEVRLQR